MVFIVWQSPGPTPLLFLRLQALPHMGWTLSSTPMTDIWFQFDINVPTPSDLIISYCLSKLSFTQTCICLSTSSSPKLCVDRPAISETSCTTDLAGKRAIWCCACDGVSKPLKFIHGRKFEGFWFVILEKGVDFFFYFTSEFKFFGLLSLLELGFILLDRSTRVVLL